MDDVQTVTQDNLLLQYKDVSKPRFVTRWHVIPAWQKIEAKLLASVHAYRLRFQRQLA